MYMIWVFVAVVLFFILLLLPIRAIIRVNDETDFYIKVLWFKIKPSKSTKTKKTKPSSVKKRNTKELLKKVLALGEDIKEFLSFAARKCLVVDNLDLKLEFGTGDAAHTGIACGGLNGVAYTAMSAIHHNTTVKKWNILITPDFEREIFSIRFDCIVRTRLLHIINIGIKGLKLYNKFKTK